MSFQQGIIGELVEDSTKRKIGIPDFSIKLTNIYNLDVVVLKQTSTIASILWRFTLKCIWVINMI